MHRKQLPGVHVHVHIAYLYILLCFIQVGAQDLDFLRRETDGNPFKDISEAGASPCFGDIDGDGDLDLVLGTADGKVFLYTNSGNTTDPIFEKAAVNPFSPINVGENAHPFLVDIDGDSDLDIFIGSKSNGIAFFLNIGSVDMAWYREIDDSVNPLGSAVVAAECCDVFPYFFDWDEDGDFDAFVLDREGYFRNIGSPTEPQFQKYSHIEPQNPFSASPHRHDHLVGIFDFDKDGDLDAFLAQENGFLAYRGNVEGVLAVMQGANPLYNYRYGTNIRATHCDVDGDGDQDIVVGVNSGRLIFLENVRWDWKVVFETQFADDPSGFVGPPTPDTMTFTPDDYDGWTVVYSDTMNGKVYKSMADPEGYDPGGALLGPTPWYDRNTENSLMLTRSPQFVIEDGDFVELYLIGGSGDPAVSSPGATPANIVKGFLGVALRLVDSDAYVLYKKRRWDGEDWYQVRFEPTNLKVYLGYKATLDIIDYHEGSVGTPIAGGHTLGAMGWIGVDNVQIPAGNKAVPTYYCGEFGYILGGPHRLGKTDWAELTLDIAEPHSLIRIRLDVIAVDAWTHNKVEIVVDGVVVASQVLPPDTGYEDIFWEARDQCGVAAEAAGEVTQFDYVHPMVAYSAHSGGSVTIAVKPYLEESEHVQSFALDNVVVEAILLDAPEVFTVTQPVSVHGGDPVIIDGVRCGPDHVPVVKFGIFECTDVRWESVTRVSCIAPPGLGQALNVVVTCWGLSSSGGEGLFYYDKPVVESVSPNVGSVGGGDLLTIYGRNFGHPSDLAGILINPHSVSIGGFDCGNVLWVSTTVLQCTSADGWGSNREIIVTSNGQPSEPAPIYSYASTFYESTMSINTKPDAADVLGTNTEGGDLIQFDGSGLGDGTNIEVTIGPPQSPYLYPCLVNTVVSSDKTIMCTTTSGMGRSLLFGMRVNETSFVSQDTFTYPAPEIASVSGCPVSTILSATLNGTDDCNRNGGDVLVIQGRNFGFLEGYPPLVFVGPYLCTNVVQDGAFPHRNLTAVLPAGRGLDLEVSVVSAAGIRSEAVAAVSFKKCDRGYYEPSATSPSCAKCLKGTATNVTGTMITCDACPPGMHTPEDGMPLCLDCPRGHQTPSRSSSVCEPCPLGMFTNVTGTPRCEPCLPGTFQDTTGLPLCSPCPDGTVAADYGARMCLTCPAGTYAFNRTECVRCDATQVAAAGSMECVDCPAGQFSFEQEYCLPCEPGYYAPSPGAAVCLPCPAGTKAESKFATGCDKCAPGWISPAASTACTPCPVGTEGSTEGNECRDCKPGYVAEGVGTPSCHVCGPGSQAVQNKSCTECIRGQYQPLDASVECLRCPELTFSNSSASTECLYCAENAVANFNQSGCECVQGYFAISGHKSAGVWCKACPPGADCRSTGVTFENVAALPGWWQDKTWFIGERELDLYFHECRRVLPANNLAEEAARIDACSGGNSFDAGGAGCRDGHAGRLCDSCIGGWFLDTDELCSECPAAGIILVQLLLMAGVVVGAIIGGRWVWKKVVRIHKQFLEYKEGERERNTQYLSQKVLVPPVKDMNLEVIPVIIKFRILLAMVQVVSQFEEMFGLAWPPTVVQLCRYFGAVNLDPFAVPSFRCIWDSYTAYDRLLFGAIFPMIAVVSLGLFAVFKKWQQKGLASKVYETDESVRFEQDVVVFSALDVKVYRWSFNIAMFTFPGATAAAIRALWCKSLASGSSYLITDMSIECGTGDHASLIVMALLVLLVYLGAFPWQLWKHAREGYHPLYAPDLHKVLTEEEQQKEDERRANSLPEATGLIERSELMRRRLGVWGEGYKQSCWWFVLADTFRLLLATGLLFCVASGTSTQLVMAAMIFLLALAALVVSQPYQRDCDMAVQTCCFTSLFFLSVGGLMVKMGVLKSDGVSNDALDYLLVTVILAPFLVALGLMFSQRLSPWLRDRAAYNMSHPTQPLSIRRYLRRLEKGPAADTAASLAFEVNPPAHELLELNCKSVIVLRDRESLHKKVLLSFPPSNPISQLLGEMQALLFEFAIFRNIFYSEKLRYQGDPDAKALHTHALRIATVVVNAVENAGLPLQPSDPPTIASLAMLEDSIEALEEKIGIKHVRKDEWAQQERQKALEERDRLLREMEMSGDAGPEEGNTDELRAAGVLDNTEDFAMLGGFTRADESEFPHDDVGGTDDVDRETLPSGRSSLASSRHSETIALMSGSGRRSKTARSALTSVAGKEIVPLQSKIDADTDVFSVELLLTLYNHLRVRGLDDSAAMLMEEAELDRHIDPPDSTSSSDEEASQRTWRPSSRKARAGRSASSTSRPSSRLGRKESSRRGPRLTEGAGKGRRRSSASSGVSSVHPDRVATNPLETAEMALAKLKELVERMKRVNAILRSQLRGSSKQRALAADSAAERKKFTKQRTVQEAERELKEIEVLRLYNQMRFQVLGDRAEEYDDEDDASSSREVVMDTMTDMI